jgi:hypothetical protein
MTPFMISVMSLLEGAPPPAPETEPSQACPVAVATDTQVVVRSLAEQLVCEANAVLRDHSTAFNLADETGLGSLSFTIGCGEVQARVETAVSGRTAVARLTAPSLPDDRPRRLTSEDELQALLLGLIAASLAVHSPMLWRPSRPLLSSREPSTGRLGCCDVRSIHGRSSCRGRGPLLQLVA